MRGVCGVWNYEKTVEDIMTSRILGRTHEIL